MMSKSSNSMVHGLLYKIYTKKALEKFKLYCRYALELLKDFEYVKYGGSLFLIKVKWKHRVI